MSYRVAEDVRERITSFAQSESWHSAGDYVEAVMRCYAEHGSLLDRLQDRLTRIKQAGERAIGGDTSLKQRRTEAIADALDTEGNTAFTLDEFDEAVNVGPQGIDASAHAREEYLPRVLEELDYTWHPDAPVFAPRDSLDLPEQRDVRGKPYVLMSDADRRRAVKTDAYAAANGREKAQFTVGDALETLDGRPQPTTVRSILRKIAADSSGFSWDGDKDRLKIDRREVERASGENAEVLNLTADTADAAEDDPDEGLSKRPTD